MTYESKMFRVSASHPCPVCAKRDWCLIAPDGTAAICSRVESTKRCGEAGWLHRLADQPYKPYHRVIRIVQISSPATFTDFAERCRSSLAPARLSGFADSLGLSIDSLGALRVGWSADHGAWTFPMIDPISGRVVGIRLRTRSGSKFAVRGSKDGLFIPATGSATDDIVLIVEGATDAAALLDMGFTSVVGRPSCSGGTRHLVALLQKRRPDRVVIVADADQPGQRGADDLAAVIRVHAPIVNVIKPPTGLKDARAWKQAGARRAEVKAVISASTARPLTILTVIRRKQ